MLILPAIDICAGRCVRMAQGDYRRVTTYAADPVAVARQWEACGATWIHLVDLDGAYAGSRINRDVIAAVRGAVHAAMQVGGGIRTMVDLDDLLTSGVDRVILGTAALNDRQLVQAAIARWGDRIVVSLDTRGRLLATSGWLETSAIPLVDAAQRLHALGVQRFIHTDIARDGMMTGPSYALLAELRAAVPVPLLAAGGIATLDHLRQLAEMGIEGAIVGRAVYTGTLDLAIALREVQYAS
jgi:phosphoribosylformimino-5-aminoimidazole carboxamide ribotide isomerase